jgi:hypothetical protein
MCFCHCFLLSLPAPTWVALDLLFYLVPRCSYQRGTPNSRVNQPSWFLLKEETNKAQAHICLCAEVLLRYSRVHAGLDAACYLLFDILASWALE